MPLGDRVLGWRWRLLHRGRLHGTGLSLTSFGSSVRIGIDTAEPDKLATSGIFAISRNPIYVAFTAVLTGQSFVFPGWILPVYVAAACWLFHRRVLREEDFLKNHYGEEIPEPPHDRKAVT